MNTPTDYTARAEAYAATCPSPAVAYAVIRGLMLDYFFPYIAKAAGCSEQDARDAHQAMRAAMSDNGQFPEAAQEAMRAALKRRVEA